MSAWKIRGEADLFDVKQWFELRGKPAPDFPEIGFRTDHAAGFLIRAEGGACFIEHLVSEPGIRQTDSELDEVVHAVCEYARQLGFKEIFGLTRLKAVTLRARKHGFRDQEYTLVSRRL
jgi:hypothetical protein